MKKNYLIIVLAALAMSGMAQRGGVAPLAKGEKQINFGTGISEHGVPAYFSMDFALHKDVTLTPYVNAKFGNGLYFGGGCKADYHWNYLMGLTKKWDFYSGAHAGFDFGHSVYPQFGIQAGGRWYFNDRWALNAEVGGGTGFASTFGMSFKL